MEAKNQVSNINIYITALPHTLRGSLGKASLQTLMRETKVIIKSRPLAAGISNNKQPISLSNLSWTFMVWFYKNSCPSNHLIILWDLTSFKLELSSGGLLLVRKRNHCLEFMLSFTNLVLIATKIFAWIADVIYVIPEIIILGSNFKFVSQR